MTLDGPEPPNNLIVLLIGGDPGSVGWAPSVSETPALVVAADSGLDAAAAAGLRVDHVVGDLDSVDPVHLAAAKGAGAAIHRHESDKDATDIELALDLVVELVAAAEGPIAAPSAQPEPFRLLVLGPGGGRLDHLFGDLLVLASARVSHLDVTARIGRATVTVVHPGRVYRIWGTHRDQVSLLPVHGTARGVTTTGLRWPLTGADLVAGTTRGISNELAAQVASVEVEAGTVVVVQPGTVASNVPSRSTPYDPSPQLSSSNQPEPRRTEP